MSSEVVKFSGEHQVSTFAPRTFDDAWRMAQAMARSGLFGAKTPEQAFALMMIADAEGRHPAAAAKDYHIIEGHPSLRADAMLARYLAAGGKIEWVERTDAKVSAKFTHASSGTVMIEWTIERAQRIKRRDKKLVDGDNWRNYPCQMLAARVISEGVRASYPAVLSGMYSPEEVIDFAPSRPAAPSPHAAGAQDAGTHETPGPTEAGAANPTDAAPVSSSVKASFTVDQNDDGNGKGKSARQAKADGDWEKVSDRLTERMAEFSTQAEMREWWEEVVATDEEYKALPRSWRQMFKETEFDPRYEALT